MTQPALDLFVDGDLRRPAAETVRRIAIDDFCSGANLFCSIDHLERWFGDNPAAGRAMTINEAAELGRECWGEASDQLTGDARWGRHGR